MALAKTTEGRKALTDRGSGLAPRERHVLILCDGKRTLSDLHGLMGAQAQAVVDDLIRRRLLTSVESAAQAALLSETGTFRGAALAASPPAVAAPARRAGEAGARDAAPAPAPATAPAAGPGTVRVAVKRSLVGSKMYVIDLLQMQRDVDASALATAVHTSVDERELIANICGALRFIRHRSGASYARRVADHLMQSIPEPLLPEVEITISEVFSSESSSIL